MVEAEVVWKATKPDSMKKVKTALSDLGWQIDEETKYSISASAPSSIFSWGETVDVRVSSNVGKTKVLIISEPKWQIIDFGKSEENVTLLRDKILEKE